jgi:hypothetical protein
MEAAWMREALFAGQTANGFKLGTTATLGWFWMRLNGCRIAYRGQSMDKVDFEDVLAVAEAGIDEIAMPGYLSHEDGETYFYVVRCANRCGDIERTMRAAAKVVIGDDGKLGKGRPNDVAGLEAEQRQDGEIEITWTYNSIGQDSTPAEMRIYGDNGAGQIDYQNPVAVVKYKGRRFYRHRIERPADGLYRFAVRAADANGNECESKQIAEVEIRKMNLEAIQIIGAI